MEIRLKIFTVIGVALSFGIVPSPRAAAEISDADFKKLADQVGQLSQQVQTLQQTHDQDQQTIDELKRQVGKTRETADSARQKADAAVQQVQQPASPAFAMATAATHNVVLTGDAEIQFGRSGQQHSGFVLADFAPVFLYRANENILFEAGFDITLQNGSTTLQNGQFGNTDSQTSINLSFATLDYLLNDYVTIVAGEMLLPLGTYSQRNAGWLNKIPDAPLPRAVLPDSGVGAQLLGAVPVGHSGSMFTYSVYAANGPGSVDGTGNSTYTDSAGNVLPNLNFGNVGINSNGTTGNLNANPSAGGRIAFFVPFRPHYDVELGLSGQTGEWDSSGQNWSAAVVDAAVHISRFFELKGEYINTWVQTTDIGNYCPRGWWVQGAYKLAGLPGDLPFIRNTEIVGRYDTVNDGLGTRADRATAGLVYYFTNTLLFEGDYEWLHTRGPNELPNNAFILQLSYGF